MPLQAPRDASRKASTWSLQIPTEHLHDMDMKQKSGRHRRSLKEDLQFTLKDGRHRLNVLRLNGV